MLEIIQCDAGFQAPGASGSAPLSLNVDDLPQPAGVADAPARPWPKGFPEITQLSSTS
jgi:hypothetical protein